MAKCVLCGSDKENVFAYGELLRKDKIVAHEFCLYLSSGLPQGGEDDDSLYGFLPEDILRESRRASHMVCCFCHKSRANIGCCKVKCHRSFHMICGLENGVENQFTGNFRSYCNYHINSPLKLRPPKGETCCICFEELVQNKKSYHFPDCIKAPCCNNGWFHKYCLQGFAHSAGYFFKCPLCNDTKKFRERVPYLGIFIRNADATWELEPNAFNELLQRPNKCEAEMCFNTRGRRNDSERDPLLCCEICGSKASHKLCLPEGMQNFICTECIPFSAGKTETEGDSGRESIQAVEEDDDEDEDVDICDISFFEDCIDDIDLQVKKEENLNVDVNVNGVNELDNQSNSAQASSSRGSTRGEDSIIKDTRNEAWSFIRFNHRDPTNENLFEDSDSDDEIDPLENFAKAYEKRRKIDNVNSDDQSKVTTTTSTRNAEDAPKTDEKPTPNHIATNRLQFNNSTNKENESDTNSNPFETSCIANRTRRRKLKYLKTPNNNNNKHHHHHHHHEDQKVEKKQNTACSGRVYQSDSSTSSRSSSTRNKQNDCNNPLELSCIANRTRRRSILYNTARNLSTICEDSSSESNDPPSRTLLNNNNLKRNRNHSKDDGFSSDSQS